MTCCKGILRPGVYYRIQTYAYICCACLLVPCQLIRALYTERRRLLLLIRALYTGKTASAVIHIFSSV